MTRFFNARLTTGVLLGVATVMAPLAAAAGPAAAATTNTPVPTGIDVPSIPGATVFGSVSASTKETVSFIMKEQNEQALESQVTSGVKSYLSVSQFAAKYGASASAISALSSYLAKYGIKTSVYADDIDVVATGTAGDFDSALTVHQAEYSVPAQTGFGQLNTVPAQTVYTNTNTPLLPASLAGTVSTILGLTNYNPFVNQVARPQALKAQAAAGGTVNATCVADFGLPNGCHLPADFAKMYNLDPLYGRANGSGQTLAIVTLAKPDPGAPQYFWANISHTTRTGTYTEVSVDGGAPGPSGAVGSDESDLDIEQSGALAPGANVISYEAPNTDFGFVDGLAAAASANIASTVSTSWGQSETNLEASVLSGIDSPAILTAFDEVFLEMAIQGQSMFVASGDSGAYAASRDLGTTNLSVQNPSDSPFDTAAGGSTLPWSGTFTGPDGSATVNVPAQRIWGWDYLWKPIAQVDGVSEATVAEGLVVGSTGGFSVLEHSPAYQSLVAGTRSFDAVQYLTPVDPETIVPGLTEPVAWTFNPNPPVTFGASNGGRAIPDVSADADPETGYLVYGASAGGLNEYGGTSFVAPQLNGATAVIDSYVGHRVGFWNPVIYAAQGNNDGLFTNLNGIGTSNDNIYYTGSLTGQYNPGVGLGLPNLAKIADIFSVLGLPF
jgi:kumamolisin